MRKTYPMAYVTAPGIIQFREKEMPELLEHDVLIQVKAAAICGSDLHIYKGLHPSAGLPVSIGHEVAGQILDIGQSVTTLKPGDRVTIEPVLSCGECEYCVRGSYHLCQNISFQYRKGQGAFTPYYVAKEKRVFKLPDGLSYAEGALIEPLSVALHAVKKSRLHLGQTSAVFGAGAIGLLVTALARQVTASRVFVSDINPFRLQKALELGATDVCNNMEADPVNVILDGTGQVGVDASFEVVGLQSTLVQSLMSLKKGGLATLLGIYEKPEALLPVNLFIQREIKMGGSQGYCWDFQDSLVLLENGAIDLKALITHKLKLCDLQQAFEILLDAGSHSVKVIIEMEEVNQNN
jgi:2-desacetyl-2-hydroxyethyl bacteriochlorophyllide A dehydrogenase